MKQRQPGAVIGCGVLMLVLLPMLYVLSYGPVGVLATNGYISGSAFEVVYQPLMWACGYCTPLWNFLVWYDSLFEVFREKFEPLNSA